MLCKRPDPRISVGRPLVRYGRRRNQNWGLRWVLSSLQAQASQLQSPARGADINTVFAGMRNLDRGSELREITSKEKLPITILQLDVDSGCPLMLRSGMC
jgi:hypothetical protein